MLPEFEKHMERKFDNSLPEILRKHRCIGVMEEYLNQLKERVSTRMQYGKHWETPVDSKAHREDCVEPVVRQVAGLTGGAEAEGQGGIPGHEEVDVTDARLASRNVLHVVEEGDGSCALRLLQS